MKTVVIGVFVIACVVITGVMIACCKAASDHDDYFEKKGEPDAESND